jgi:O-antigen ligase
MRLFGLALLITLPWLNPFSPGPSAAVVPLLFAWACVAGLLLLRAGDRGPAARQRWGHAMAGAWLVAACVSAVIGLLQYFGATSGLGVWANHTEVGLAYGNLRQRNQFASLMTIGLAALLWWAAQTSPDGAGRHTGRFGLAMALAVLLGAGNAASSSRTGLLQLLLVVALSLHWRHRARRQATLTPAASALPWVLLAAVLGYAVANWALPWLAGLDPSSRGAWARLRAGDSVCASRLTLWRNVLYLIAQKPWLGWGWGELDYAHFITLYPGARFCDILDNAHNLPLHLAVVLGVPAAVLLCGAGLWLVWRARPWRETDATRQLAWGVLAVMGLHSLLEYPLWYGPFQVAGVLCLWLLWRPMLIDEFRRFRALAFGGQASIAIILMIFISYVAWDYHRVRQIFLLPAQRAAAYQTDTLEKAQGSWWFARQVRFAELTTTRLTSGNAMRLNALTKDLLHFSPEPRVIETLIDSAVLLGRDDEVEFYTARYRAAFPERYARWVKGKV